MKAVDYGKRTSTVAAFVATNSVCQGRQVDTLWSLILRSGHEIAFAHTSFKWANLASHKAGVTVVIVAISNHASRNKRLFSTTDDNSVVVKETENINPYLAPGPNVIVQARPKSLSDLKDMSFGSMPNDGGHLLLRDAEAREAITRHNVDPSLIRPFVGSQEFIRGVERRCVWVREEQFEAAQRNNWLSSRFQCVGDQRAASRRSTTKQLASWPFRFGEVRQDGDEVVTIVPSVSSESREYLPVGFLNRGTIVSNLAFALCNAPLWNLALIASRVHLVWIATVCGKLETRYRYSNTLGWNTFPVPTLTEKNKADLTRCAEDILLARETHFPDTIADLYDPDKMPADLHQAHELNDETLERIYIGRRFRNDTERLEKLFELYTKMVASKDSQDKGRTRERSVEAGS